MDYFNSQDFGPHVEELLRQNHVPGLSIAVVQDEEIASAGYGVESLDTNQPCTADTLFDIASVSKSLTAASVALLVKDNKSYPEVQYDAIMSNLLPDDFVMSSESHTAGATVDDVLGHRTGMPGHDDSCLGIRAKEPDDARSITRNLRNLPVVAPLRARYFYCNMMYTVATHLVEVKSKQSFADFLDHHIFKPLRMESTHLQPERVRAHGLGERMAAGHFWNKESATYSTFQPSDSPEGQGAGSVVSSANDLILWAKALMNREGPIDEKVYQGLVRMRSFRDPSNVKKPKPLTSPAFYAAGLELYYYRGHTVIWHDGNVSGFSSRLFFLPEFKFGAVVMGNSMGALAVGSILMRELIDEAVGVPLEERRWQNNGKTPKKADRGTQNIPINLKKEQRKDKKEKNNKGGKPKDGLPEGKGVGSQGSQATRLSKGKKETHPQVTPLTSYMGDYKNAGYHTMKVEMKDDKLFIDALDRSLGFTLTFEHVKDQIKYTAYLEDAMEGGSDPVDAEFVFEGEMAVKMGLDFEPALKELIWFDRVVEQT